MGKRRETRWISCFHLSERRPVRVRVFSDLSFFFRTTEDIIKKKKKKRSSYRAGLVLTGLITRGAGGGICFVRERRTRDALCTHARVVLP